MLEPSGNQTARDGKNSKRVPLDIRQQIVDLYKAGTKSIEIASIVNYGVATVRYTIKKFKIYGTIEDRPTGRTGQMLANQERSSSSSSVFISPRLAAKKAMFER